MVYHPIIFYWINILKFHHWIYIFSMLLTHIPNFVPRERDFDSFNKMMSILLSALQLLKLYYKFL